MGLWRLSRHYHRAHWHICKRYKEVVKCNPLDQVNKQITVTFTTGDDLGDKALTGPGL